MLGQKVLMLFLRRVETVVALQLGHNRFVEGMSGVELADVGLGHPLLFAALGENGRAILGAGVRP